MIQALQAQMEEIRQKSMADQLKNDDRRRHEQEMSFLNEQNINLQQRIEDHEREEQTHQSQPPNPPTHQSRAPPSSPPTHQTPHNFQTQQTHQSSRNNIAPDEEEDLGGQPFTDEIINTLFPPKWKGLTIKPYDGSTDPDEHLKVFKTQMTLYPTNKVVWCKVFPTSL